MPRRLRAPVTYDFDTPPRKGDYGLTAGGGAAMWVTRIGTLSRYGHACIALADPWEDAQGRSWIRIIEAAPRGARVRNVPVDSFRWSNLVLTEAQREAIAQRALTTEGIPYDWMSILGFVKRVIGVKLNLLKTKDKPDDKMVCSELVVWSYYAANIDLGQGKAPGDVSPGDLAEYLVSH